MISKLNIQNVVYIKFFNFLKMIQLKQTTWVHLHAYLYLHGERWEDKSGKTVTTYRFKNCVKYNGGSGQKEKQQQKGMYSLETPAHCKRKRRRRSGRHERWRSGERKWGARGGGEEEEGKQREPGVLLAEPRSSELFLDVAKETLQCFPKLT